MRCGRLHLGATECITLFGLYEFRVDPVVLGTLIGTPHTATVGAASRNIGEIPPSFAKPRGGAEN